MCSDMYPAGSLDVTGHALRTLYLAFWYYIILYIVCQSNCKTCSGLGSEYIIKKRTSRAACDIRASVPLRAGIVTMVTGRQCQRDDCESGINGHTDKSHRADERCFINEVIIINNYESINTDLNTDINNEPKTSLIDLASAAK